MKRQINFWFICRFTMLCIILEERRKMRKKILDAALLFAFALCLIVTSNIQEEAAYVAELENEAVPLQEVSDPTFGGEILGKGVAVRPTDGTESDEKTGVEKKDVVLVTTSNDSESNLEEETDGSVETNTEVSESGQVEEVSGTSQAPAYNNRWNISLTDEEIDLLAKIVWLEANGEPVEGQEAVVEVVLNRMASDLYPDTLYDVLSQNNPVQFVSWKRRDKAHPTETEYQSIYNVLNGNTDLLRNDTMNFSTYPLTSNLDVKICCHYFCY
jgi:N-acetylmuramoyl-L-alanine amidase